MSKKRKRQRVKVKQGPPTLPWEMPHPVRGHERNSLTGQALVRKYPLMAEEYDLMDHRLPGSFENGKNR